MAFLSVPRYVSCHCLKHPLAVDRQPASGSDCRRSRGLRVDDATALARAYSPLLAPSPQEAVALFLKIDDGITQDWRSGVIS